MDGVRFIFHVIAFVITLFTTLYHTFKVKVGNEGMGGKLKYLTYWNMLFQTAYFGLCVITDVLESESMPNYPSQRGTLQKWRDNFHASVAFPTSVFVCVTFWTLYAIDRELVFPRELDGVFPQWLNHLLHTTILPFSVIDKLVTRHFYPDLIKGLIGCAAVALSYLTWVFVIAYVDSFWVYPVLEVLNVFQRAAFLSVCVAVFGSFYILGDSITSRIWGSVPAQRKSRAGTSSGGSGSSSGSGKRRKGGIKIQ